MKVLDLRDGFIKFEANENIFLSSFILINSTEKSYIAQVLQIKKTEENPIAFAKILFLYNGELLNYDKTLPSFDSEIKEFTSEILQNSISAENPVIVGKTFGNNNIVVDSSAFDKKMLISIDDNLENNIIVRNLVKQFENLSKKVVILDTLGVVEAKKSIAGVDFKLPLDTASLNFMYQDCLNDATQESKSLIIEIFKDLAEYSQTVPFVPFGILKNIVDDMVDKSHVFKLLVLKNKLAKFEQLGYFAKNKTEVEKLNHILESDCAIIDLSKLDPAFQNRYLSFIYETLSKFQDRQVILELSNTVSKKNLKEILTDSDIPTAFITHSRFKFLNDIKNMFDNFIISPSVENNKIFNIYQTFLNSMPKKNCLIAGEAVNYIPFISKVESINEFAPKNEPVQIDTLEEELNIETSNEVLEEEKEGEIPSIIEEEVIETVDQAGSDTLLENINEKSEEAILNIQESINVVEPVSMFSDDEDEVIEENTLSEADLDQEDIPASSEVSLSESYTTEVHMNEDGQDLPIEITEYEVLPENTLEIEEAPISEEISEDQNEISITEQTDTFPIIELENDLPLDEDVIEQEEDIEKENEIEELQEIESEGEVIVEEEDADAEIISDKAEADAEEISIVLDDNIDLDLESLSEESIQEQEEILEQDSDFEEEQEIAILPISDDVQNDDLDFESIVELDPDEALSDDIVIDIADEDLDEVSDNLDQEIVQDVDKVFSTMKEDNISDSDLDFIDELNNEDDVLLEEVAQEAVIDEGQDEILEEISDSSSDDILKVDSQNIELEEEKQTEPEILETRNSSTPIVPVYDAEIPPEDMVMSDPIQQGDTVSHAKYGVGVVEKMIKYGNKTLFSINFDNVGRRLLDPTLTEIKKA